MPGPQELLVIAVVALLVFGPDRLPELARTAGKWLGRLRSETHRNVEELKRLSEIQQLQADLQGLKRELDDARDDVTREVKGFSGLAEDAASGRGNGERGDAGAASPNARRRAASSEAPPRADEDPPPFDPEAT
ncbi:MAG: twin-arginine translocase TatA/TatE family subunit [Nitriliruptoraceae bacterium]